MRDDEATSNVSTDGEVDVCVVEDSALSWEGSEPMADDAFVPDLNGFYTYADYLRMKLKGRWELIRGVLIKMSAPRDPHQAAVQALAGDLRTLLKREKCTARVAPYDVRLFADVEGRDTTVVQPDVCVICDRAKITSRGCYGAPDLVIEVLSPSTAKKDRVVKTPLYDQAGVREYWIVDLELKRIEQRVLPDGGRIYPLPTLYHRGDEVVSAVVPSFRVSVSELMDEANEFANVEAPGE